MDRRARGQGGQVILNRSNLVQQPERSTVRSTARSRSFNGNRLRREQPRARRLRRVVALAKRLEHVDEQARRRVKAGECFGGRHAIETARPDQSPDDRAVLLLRPTPWSFFRYDGLDRVSSIRCSLQKAISSSLRNSLPLSVSIPRNGNGSAPRSWSTASTTSCASRTSSGTHSVRGLYRGLPTTGTELAMDLARRRTVRGLTGAEGQWMAISRLIAASRTANR